jgi:mono/diheme cytochrome c family protein
VWISALRISALLWLTAVGVRASVLAQSDSNGWHIPSSAADEANPIAVSAAVVAKGQTIYKSKCQKCHGATGVGNGPDADRDHPPGDLTDGKRANRNPDGVMFYKVWEGRKDPKMPAFKTDLSRDDVWTVIHYVKTLRK